MIIDRIDQPVEDGQWAVAVRRECADRCGRGHFVRGSAATRGRFVARRQPLWERSGPCAGFANGSERLPRVLGRSCSLLCVGSCRTRQFIRAQLEVHSTRQAFAPVSLLRRGGPPQVVWRGRGAGARERGCTKPLCSDARGACLPGGLPRRLQPVRAAGRSLRLEVACREPQ